MTASEFYKLLKLGFPFQPTLKQDAGLQLLATFIMSTSKENVFLLKGYAGTGKTTTITHAIKQLSPSTLSKQEMARELKWFQQAAMPFTGKSISVVSEDIPTHLQRRSGSNGALS